MAAVARGLLARARPAVRLLHARHADRRARHRPAPAGRRRAAHPGGAVRQSVPLHRLSSASSTRCAASSSSGAAVPPPLRRRASAAAAAGFAAFVRQRRQRRRRRLCRRRPRSLSRSKGWTQFEESFVIRQRAGRGVARLRRPAGRCRVPAGRRADRHDAHMAKGKMTVKLGPIVARLRRLGRDRARRCRDARRRSAAPAATAGPARARAAR